MLDHCSHQFVWPRRARDGRYYQVCRICEAEFEYDWESMQRLQGGDMSSTDVVASVTANGDMASAHTEPRSNEPEMAPGPEVVAPAVGVQPLEAFGPRLLLEREPAHRVFFQNLADLILFRSPPPIVTTSTPAPFWGDVFVHARVPWWWFVESLLGHLIVLTAVLILFQKWPSEAVQQPSVFQRSYLSYYTPPKSFPALRSHSSRPRVHQPGPTHRPAIRVAPESAQRQAGKRAGERTMIQPPALAPTGAARLRITAPNLPAPMMPLSATGSSHLTVPAGPTWVVAPPPDSGLPTARRAGQLLASAVAPAPEVAGVSSDRGVATSASQSAVVAPPPSVPGSMRRAGEINIGPAAVVEPPPQLPTYEQGTVSEMARGTLGGRGGAAVPPPPSVQSSGNLPGGRASLLAGTGLQVVPPAPSVQGASNIAGGHRANGLSPAGLQVIPPAPSVLGAGDPAGVGRTNSMSAGLQAVPPAPSVQGAGSGADSGAGSGRASPWSAGLQAVPPAPSVQGTLEGDGSGAGSGRLNSLSTGAGLQAMPPAASGQGAGGGAGNSPTAGGPSSETGQDAPSPIVDSQEPATLEIPLRLIGPVLALPGSSYFSNYEVFIAERKLAKDRSQLIKLVYISLPYQRRLSEYGPSNWTVAKLRVTRDRACDESLLQMTWPETDPRPDSQHSADSPALSSRDRNGMLPCYRTTADDYRRALSRNH